MANRKNSRKRNDNSASGTSVLPTPPPARAEHHFPIVGVGASAGGLEAFTDLLRALPAYPGMAFVFVQHQEPKHISMLPEILARSTAMPVRQIAGNEFVEVDQVYVAPPDAHVVIAEGKLQLTTGDTGSMPIDHFLRSLAEDQGSRAVGVILSGAASDGSLGTRAIKAEGGMTFAEDQTAKFDSMPRSAIAAGSIDFVMPPEAIANELVRIGQQWHAAKRVDVALPEKELAKLFELLHRSHDVDFSNYKPATVERRVRRRMLLNKIETLDHYLTFIHDNPAELEELYRDVLIRVTNFFRDPQVFEALQREVFPVLIREHVDDKAIRIWVPGCATGEEVYSLAIALIETLSKAKSSSPVQIFGTDVSDGAVDHARAGIYPQNVVADVSPARLERFFTKVNGEYRVTKSVRDCCIFARQNLTKDPPFTRLDLVSCRNVMIYLGPVLQRRVMGIFHYALRPNGYLLLGSSETVGSFLDQFGIVDRKHRIYRKKPGSVRIVGDFERAASRERPVRVRMNEELPSPTGLFHEADRVLLSRYAPAGVLINENMEIVQFRGRTSAFLEPAPGSASLNLLKMAREGLLVELRATIHSARKTDSAARREGIHVKNNGGTITVNIEVVPFVAANKERFQLVIFEEVSQPIEKSAAPKRWLGKKSKASKGESDGGPQLSRLKRELEATREYLQSIIEEQETMNEELRSANEETQSSNEELQSTNEELETAKEELQSTNEELTTLNEELENRNQELNVVNSDLINLLTAVDIPILMLDSALRIRRFNPGAQRILNLIPSDLGRSINDMKLTLVLDDLDKMIEGVVDDLGVREVEVQDRNGKWYSLRIRPYKTTNNKIDGAVLVLVEIKK